MNLIQSILDVVLGEGVLSVADIDPDLLFLGCLFMGAFAYLALRSLSRWFLTLNNKF